jgi:hypothetical protein
VQADAGGWSWQGTKNWAQDKWEDWRQRPQQWASAARQSTEDLQQRWSWSKVEEWQQQFSWQRVEDWQERHWRAFQERQRRRLESLTEEQRQRWEKLTADGGQLVREEVEAFERWQQRVWGPQNPEGAAGAPATCPQCRLSFLMLPLLPNIRESFDRFSRRTKVVSSWGFKRHLERWF